MLLEDSKTLGDCGFTNQTARPQAPATVGLAFRISGEFPFPALACGVYGDLDVLTMSVSVTDDAFEPLRIEAFSSPPELPDVMKPQDSGSTANEQAVQ